MSDLTQNRLRDVLSYDPESGVFIWRVVRAHRMSPGDIAGCRTSRGYWHIRVGAKLYLAHRLAWLYVYGEWPDGQIDHINGIHDDNSIQNLRVAKSQGEQNQNRKMHSNNKSGYPGVSWDKRHEAWVANIAYRKKNHHLGYFDSPEEAGLAYKEAKAKLHKFCPKVRDFSYQKAVCA